MNTSSPSVFTLDEEIVDTWSEIPIETQTSWDVFHFLDRCMGSEFWIGSGFDYPHARWCVCSLLVIKGLLKTKRW